MNALDIIILETAIPAACLLLYVLILGIQDWITERWLLSINAPRPAFNSTVHHNRNRLV